MGRRRPHSTRPSRTLLALLSLLVVVALAGSAAASASGGHLPGFSLLDKKVGVAKLPESLRFIFGGIPGAKRSGIPHVGHGPYWFGEAQRPDSTIDAAGNKRLICVSEVRGGEYPGGASCTSPAATRELGLLDVSACGKGAPRHFRIYGLAPDGVAALQIEKPGGSRGRSIPVIDNAFAFSVGRENIALRGVGDPAAEELERYLPLAESAKRSPGDGQAGCSSFTYFEAPAKGAAG